MPFASRDLQSSRSTIRLLMASDDKRQLLTAFAGWCQLRGTIRREVVAI
jgi:hypothetical protein